MVAASELPISTNASAMDMAQEIFGDGVTVNSATYSGDNRSSGIYTNGDAVSPEVTPADTGVMLSTGRLSKFTNHSGDANHSSSTSTNTSGVNHDADFDNLAGANTYDASILEVNFVPDSDTMTLQFVFSSDEYPEYAGTIYNDMVGVWVNGQNVPLAVGSGTTAVGTVNESNNENLYIDNTNSDYNTEMDGFTVTMTLVMNVDPGVENSIKIGVADVGDSVYDSTLLIAGNSAQTALIANDDEINIAPDGTKVIDVLGNDQGPSGSTLVVTEINGIAVNAGDSVTLKTGQVVTLNADGTFTVVADSDVEDVNFTYSIADTSGATSATDTAFVKVHSVPCFVSGTRIATPEGKVPVEHLSPGALVLTKDNGPQPVRWVGRRTVAAEGSHAPVRIAANSLGRHRDLMVSPQHRVLIKNAYSELFFGEPEVLIAAKDLVNGSSIRQVAGGEVEYVHILFDAHQIVFSEGLATESFLPGPHLMEEFEREIAMEIQSIFPELDLESGVGFPGAARPMLKSFEARLVANRKGAVAA